MRHVRPVPVTLLLGMVLCQNQKSGELRVRPPYLQTTGFDRVRCTEYVMWHALIHSKSTRRLQVIRSKIAVLQLNVYSVPRTAHHVVEAIRGFDSGQGHQQL